jgi:hypothetical protein
MFVPSKVIAALESHAAEFEDYQRGDREQIDRLRRQLEEVAALSAAALRERLSDIEYPGALPTIEQDQQRRPVIRFAWRWQNHEEARAWALETLQGRPTLAIDGSQIMPQRVYSLPVAMIQIGWFENPHQAGVSYEKDVEVEVLPPSAITYIAPDDLLADSELLVGLRRYQREISRLITYLQEHAGDPKQPVAFFDGSLVASFAARISPPIREAYIRSTCELLAASRRAGVAVIGYVDTSYARDLVAMVEHATTSAPSRLTDAGLLAPAMGWGDRTPAYICARDEILAAYRDPQSGEDLSRQVGFVYLKTTADNPPARVEFPLWLLDAGRLDDTLDIVRAETIVGNGYPYPLETADAVAVLTLEDRERFYQVFQEFARRHALSLRFSRKALSKRQRRV